MTWREGLIFRLERLGDFALLAFTFCLPLSISFSQMALALLVVVRVAVWVLGSKPRLFGNPWLSVFLILYVVSSIVSAAVSPIDPSASMKKLANLWIIASFVVAHEQVKREQQLVNALKLLLIGGGIAGVYGVYQHLFCSHPLAIGIEGRVRELAGYCKAIGFFDHHLTYATQMVMVALVGAGFSLSQSGKERILYMAISIVVILGIVFSYARGPWLGFVAAMLVFFWSWQRRIAVAAGALFFVGVLTLAFVSPSLKSRAETAFSSSANADRIALWKTSVDMIRDHLWLGVGPGMYRFAIPPYREGYNVRFLSAAHAHHNVLQELAERGLIGTVFLIAFWFTIFYVGARKLEKLDGKKRFVYLGMQTAIFSLWVAGMFQYNLGDAENAMLAYLICGCITSGDGNNDNKSE